MKKKLSKVLSDLKKGQKATIKGFIKEDKVSKLIEMGLLPGVEIGIIFSSFFGGPIYINYGKGNSHLLLNKEQAGLILIK